MELFAVVFGSIALLVALALIWWENASRKGTSRSKIVRSKARFDNWVPRDEWYGEAHAAERAKYASVIREHGGICMEHECVMPTRRIEAGAYWHLGHDHVRGGQFDYVGPTHPECNEEDAIRRGVNFGHLSTDELFEQLATLREEQRQDEEWEFDPEGCERDARTARPDPDHEAPF